MKILEIIRAKVPKFMKNKVFVFTLICLSISLDNMNVSATLNAQITIQKQFNSTSTITSWALSAYALTLGSFILVFGKLADILGPHNVFLFGLTVVWICSLVSATINKSIIAFLIFRAIQGIGASALIPSGFSLTANYFGKNSQHLQFAIAGLLCALTAGFGVGTIIGGAFAETKIGYKSLYYFFFSFGFLLNCLLILVIIPIEKTKAHEDLKIKNLNYGGIIIFVAGILLIILGVTEGGDTWRSPKAYVPLPVGCLLVFMVFFFEIVYLGGYKKKYESHRGNDIERDSFDDSIGKKNWRLTIDLLFPPECLKIPNFMIYFIGVGFYYIVFTILLVGLVQYHIYVEDNSSIITALKVLPLSVGLVFGALIYRESFYQKIASTRCIMLFSAGLTLGMSVWMTRMRYDYYHGFWKFQFVSLFICGYSINLFFNIYMNSVLANTPMHLQGAVSGIYQTYAQVLISLSNALVASLLGKLNIARTLEEKHLLHNKFEHIWYLVLGSISGAFLALIFVKDDKNARTGAGAMETKPEGNIDIDQCDKISEAYAN